MYASKQMARQIGNGISYDEINDTIMINILDEDFFRLSTDSEYSTPQNIDINGFNAELCSFHDEYYIIWYDSYHFISINTNIAEEELVKIAKNIKKFH